MESGSTIANDYSNNMICIDTMIIIVIEINVGSITRVILIAIASSIISIIYPTIISMKNGLLFYHHYCQ